MELPPLREVIVFGASGFIGRNIAEALSGRKNLRVAAHSSKTCDLLNPSSIRDALYHSTEATSVVFCSAIGRHLEDSWDSMLKNASMVNNFVNSLADNGLRSLIYLSSVCVYGAPALELPIRESTALAPSSYYGVSKMICEALLRFGMPKDCPVSVVRLPGVYGPGDSTVNVIARLASQLRERGCVRVTGDGSSRRDFVYVKDICRIVELLLERPHHGVINAATGESSSIRQVAELLADSLQVPFRAEFVAGDSLRDHDLIFDNSKLRSVFPELQLTALAEGVRNYLQWQASSGKH